MEKKKSSLDNERHDVPIRETIVSLFRGLDEALLTSTYSRKLPKPLRKQIQHFLQQLDVIPKSLPEIFFDRMYKDRDVLSRELYHQYKKAFLLYRDSCSEELPILQAVIDYLTTHEVDPDNSLLGLTVSQKIVSDLGLFSSEEKRVNEEEKLRLDEMVTKDKLQKKILAWRSMQDVDVRSEITELARILDKLGGGGFSKGGLVLVRYQGKITFGRFIKKEGDDKASIYLSPDEKEHVLVGAQDIRLLPQKIVDSCGNARTMQQMVENPIENLMTEMCQTVEKIVIQYMRENKIDTGLLDKLNSSPIDEMIPDLPKLHTLSTQLDSLSIDQSTSILSSIDDLYRNRCKSLLQHLDLSSIFPTLRTDAIQTIKASSLNKYARGVLMAQQHHCASTLEQIAELIDQVKSGERKSQLTTWWLQLISTRANDFLSKREYCFDAVPEDYIETAPADPGLVIKNFRLIEQILNPKSDVHAVQHFVEELRAEIYPRIEEFLRQATRVLCHELKQDPKKFDHNKEMEAYRARGEVTWIGGLLEDIGYIAQMKEMEDKKMIEGESQGKLVMSSVVPISGLILGHFHILENILRTVMEVWGIRPNQPPALARTPSQLQLRVKNSSPSLETEPSEITISRFISDKTIDGDESNKDRDNFPHATHMLKKTREKARSFISGISRNSTVPDKYVDFNVQSQTPPPSLSVSTTPSCPTNMSSSNTSGVNRVLQRRKTLTEKEGHAQSTVEQSISTQNEEGRALSSIRSRSRGRTQSFATNTADSNPLPLPKPSISLPNNAGILKNNQNILVNPQDMLGLQVQGQGGGVLKSPPNARGSWRGSGMWSPLDYIGDPPDTDTLAYFSQLNSTSPNSSRTPNS
eukprot:TRINITY_DN4746_c0_g1_i2.p1 TRINITY_DN4746_c0_g1~~TRINITY_DN4746_c0_g1_i2.p1  ORF type:complete len:863 (-),score=172.36 TRINITY_DN4746_c0_g1_i2:137-2725(-)